MTIFGRKYREGQDEARRTRRRGSHLANLGIFLFVAVLYLGGALEFIEHQFMDLQARLNQRDATGNLVLVEMDEYSLQEIGVWPWPRRYHAEVLDRLVAADVSRIALDVDLSSRQSPEDDARLERALAAAEGRVILPTFRQFSRTGSGPAVLETRPLPAFRRHVRLAGFNVRPERDQTIRRMDVSAPDGTPALAYLLADEPALGRDVFYIDFGIRAASIPRLSYVDVLRGDFDADALAGKTVVIGAAAVQLGDMVPVPMWRSLPGAAVQGLAYESLVQGRALHRIGDVPVLLITLLLAVVLGARLQRLSWRSGLVVVLASTGMLVGAAVVLHAATPTFLELTPWLLAVILAYGAGLVRHIDRQSLHLFVQAMAHRRQDAFTRLIVENSFDGIIVTNGQGLIHSINASAQDIFGYHAAETLGEHASMLLADASADRDGRADSVFCQTGTREVTGRHKDGSALHLDLTTSRAVLEGEDIFITIIRDVTARKRAEARAEEAQLRLREAVESMPAALMLYDAKDRLVLCNNTTREFFPEIADMLVPGTTVEALTRARLERAPPVGATGDTEHRVREIIERFRNPGDPIEEEHANGCWMQAYKRRMSDGGTVSVRVDVTRLKEREQKIAALAESYAQVAAGVEAATTGLAITDPNAPGNPIIFVNPAFTALTGYARDEVVGRSLSMLQAGDDDTTIPSAVESAAAGETATLDMPLQRGDGGEAWLEFTISPVRDDDGRTGYLVCVLTDISDRIAASRALVAAKNSAETANQAKSRFLAMMSHELRTPLNIILGFSEMMDDGIFGRIENEQYNSYVRDIRQSAAHLLGVINGILDMAKIDAGRLELAEDDIVIPDLVDDALNLFRREAAEKDLRILANIPSALPALHADERLVKQILLNLLSNAFKFTDSGGRVEVAAYTEPEGGLAISVADTGIGMAEEDIVRALEPFGQIDSSLSRRYEGTGLGLPLAKRFAELHGGELSLSSTVDVGTVAIIRFPASRVVDEPEPRPELALAAQA